MPVIHETNVSCYNTSCRAIISFTCNYCPICGVKQPKDKFGEDLKTNKREGKVDDSAKILLNEEKI